VMPELILRLAQRNASWEKPAVDNIEELVRTEFYDEKGQPDLRLSVFVVDSADQVVQVCAEYRASLGLGPRGKYVAFNVNGLFEDLAENDGATRFTFTQSGHREIVFASEQHLRKFVEQLIAEADSRRVEITRAQVKTYVANRYTAKDPEWDALSSDNPSWKP
jgi:hypothetical protein